MKPEKFCPIIEPTGCVKCMGESCAWWGGGGCVMIGIMNMLSGIDRSLYGG